MTSAGEKGLLRLGIISDTHGLLRPQVPDLFRGCDRILHAGDVGRPEILQELEQIAPVTAVRGNVDSGPWADRLPITEVIEVGGKTFYMVHDLSWLDLDPAAGFDAVIFGHSHRPAQYTREGVFYLNPGSAGPRRFRLPISLALLELGEGRFSHRLIELSS